MPASKRGTVTILGVGGRVAVAALADRWPQVKLYAIRGQSRVSRLGAATAAQPAADGRSLWVKSLPSASGCSLRHVRLDGAPLPGTSAIPCKSTIGPAGSAGLVVSRTQLLDPLTGRTLYTARWGVWAVSGSRLVLAGPDDDFTVVDPATGEERAVPRPETLYGLDEPAVDPRGRYVVLAFADPAWEQGSKQALDLWLLDTEAAKLAHLPGMPAFLLLKSTSMAWTDDGRLVLLGKRMDDSDFAAVWRPGQRRLALKTLHLPVRNDSGSDTFAPIR